MARAPFFVQQSWSYPGQWELYMRHPSSRRGLIGTFPSMGAAIDYAYKTWPWWP